MAAWTEKLDKKKVKDYILIVAGTFIMAIGVKMIYDPMEMVTGGVTGLAIVVKALTEPLIEGGIPLWLSNAFFNVPLFLAALFMKGRKFLGKTLFATISLTVALYLVPEIPLFAEDYLLAALFGGVVGGAGIGLVFSTMATTGGTDLLCMLIHEKKKYYTIPQLMAVVDGAIVLFGVIVFGLNRAMYAIIAVYITSKVSDGILEGMKFAKLAYIISDRYEEIAQRILVDLDRGVTSLPAKGMYSNESKNMLLCAVSKKEIVALYDIIHKIDPAAFVIVSDAREIMGEGFIEYKQENL